MIARSAAAPELDAWLDDDARFGVDLMLTELVTNAVKHGTCVPGAEVRVEAGLFADCVCVEVTNTGAPFEPCTEAPGLLDTNGRGLLLVDSMAGRWGVQHEDGSTTVWFEVDAS